MNMNDELDMLLNDTRNLTDEELIDEYEKEYSSNINLLNFKEKELSNNFTNGLSEEIKKIKQRQEYLTLEIQRLKQKVEEKNERIRKFKESENTNTNNETYDNVEEGKSVLEDKNISLEEIEESLSKTVELPKINGDDEPTLELSEKMVEEINEKSKNYGVNESKKIENIKIVYTAKNGTYTISAMVNNELKSSTFVINRNLINSNSKKDTNIIPLLEVFDKENNTNLKQKFSDDNLEYNLIYDLRSQSKLHRKILNSKDKKELKKFAKRQSKENENIAYISNFSKKKAAILLGTALVGTTALYGVNKNTNIDINDKKVIESTTENKKEDLYTSEEIRNTESTKTTEEQKSSDKKEYIIVPNEKTVVLEDEPSITDYKIGDIIDLENIDLYYSSDSLEPIGNTENKKCDKYQITMMSVVHDGKVIENYQKDASLNDLKEKYQAIYGDDFKISMNANGLDKDQNTIYRNIGWFDSNDLTNEYENVKIK